MKRLTSRLNTIDWYLAAALLLAWAAALPLLEPHALLNTRGGGDSPFLLQRTHQLLAALGQGQFPVRWMPDGYYGYGYPFFNFYAPLSIYIAAGFKLLGFSYTRAIQLAQLAGFLVAAWGMYALALRITARRAASLIASIAYTFAPFHMVNVYVRGDSLAEFWAMAFYPLTLLSAEILLKSSTRAARIRAALALAVTFACLVLSHNISALIFSPFLLLFCLLRLPSGKSKMAVNFAWLAIAALIGVGLAAWFWLPALAEQGLVQLAAVTEGFFNYAAHFRGADIVQIAAAFSYDVSGTQNPFRMGLLQAILLAVGVGIVLVGWRRTSAETRPFTLFAILTTAVATLMITPLSRIVWDMLPLLSFTQFPWRFLSVQALGGALLIGSAAVPFLGWVEQKNRLMPFFVTGLLTCVIGWSALADLKTDFVHLTDADVTAQQLIEYEWFTGNVGTTISAEYLPIGVQPRAWGDGTPIGTRADLWWPGTRMDGELAIAAPGSGLVVGEGVVQQGRTVVAFSAESISLIFLLATAALAWRYRSWSARHLLLPVALLLLLAIGARLTQSQPAWADSQLDTRSWDLGQKAYLHHAPNGILFSDGSVLRGYEVTTTDDRIDVALHMESDGAEIEIDLVSPAVYRETERQPAPIYASQTEPIAAGETTVVVSFSAESLPPTRLLPRVRLANAFAMTDTGLPRGDLFLAPITFDVDPIQKMVGRLQVEVKDVTTRDDGDLYAFVEWTTPDALVTNYQASWKLYDRFGRFYAEVDAQPGYGYLPTATWPPNTVINDYVRLRWLADDGIAPFTLVATLRDVAADALVYQEQVALLDADGALLSQRAGVFDQLPNSAERVQAEFADEIVLRGVALERHDELQAVVLYWEALTPELADYARFVHVIDSKSGDIVVQVDSQPQYNSHPTTRWQPGVLIEDVVALDLSMLAAASYEIRVGLYHRMGDGQRLDVISAELPITDKALHLPLTLNP